MAFRELKGTGGGNFFKWLNAGDKFVGQFKALATGDYNGKTTFHAVFTDKDGKTVKVNTPTILRDKLMEAESGMLLEVIYTQNLQAKKGQSPAKDFRVTVVDSYTSQTQAQTEQAQATPQSQPQTQPQSQPVEDPAIAAARAMLLGQAQASKSPYEQLKDKLVAKDAKGASALIAALEQIYTTEPARVDALSNHLKAQGVAV